MNEILCQLRNNSHGSAPRGWSENFTPLKSKQIEKLPWRGGAAPRLYAAATSYIVRISCPRIRPLLPYHHPDTHGLWRILLGPVVVVVVVTSAVTLVFLPSPSSLFYPWPSVDGGWSLPRLPSAYFTQLIGRLSRSAQAAQDELLANILFNRIRAVFAL